MTGRFLSLFMVIFLLFLVQPCHFPAWIDGFKYCLVTFSFKRHQVNVIIQFNQINLLIWILVRVWVVNNSQRTFLCNLNFYAFFCKVFRSPANCLLGARGFAIIISTDDYFFYTRLKCYFLEIGYPESTEWIWRGWPLTLIQQQFPTAESRIKYLGALRYSRFPNLYTIPAGHFGCI